MGKSVDTRVLDPFPPGVITCVTTSLPPSSWIPHDGPRQSLPKDLLLRKLDEDL